MKKKLLFLLVAALGMLLPVKAQTIVLSDGFESGDLSQWTQEFVEGQAAWAVESVQDNLLYPNGVLQGTKRAYLRNTTGETQGFVTRLVSPVMKLDTVYQPMVVFWYANPKWTTDRDTLRLLYKAGSKAEWKQLSEFSDAHANWTKVAISLPDYCENYQIAFEGKDNLGRGIVLDSVLVRSAPECTVPHDFSIQVKGNGKAALNWQASWDATEFHVVITQEKIAVDTLASVPDSVLIYNQKVDGLKHNLEVELTSGEYYYAYIRSICEAETSDWSQPYYFRMKATMYLPYFYDFNMEYNAGKVNRNVEWSYGNNTGHYNPLISTHLNATENAKYSKDATTSLMFTGNNNATTAIPAGQYVYAATPGLSDSTVADFKLKDYQVRFWSTVATYTGAYAHSLIVGVMTDPEDVTTFVPVDTVRVWGTSTFKENIVSLENYEGNGIYVAFASAFDKQNVFYIDDMTIERRPQVNKVTEVSVNPRDTFATITWKTTGAAKYKVLVADVDLEPSKIKPENIIDQAEVTTNSYTTNKLQADHSWNRPYYVYVQADDAEWSYREPFVTIARKDLPMVFDMEQASGCYYLGNVASTMYPSNIGIFSNDPEYPYIYATNPKSGAGCLYMVKHKGNDTWVTFPISDAEKVQDVQITFFLSGNTYYAQTHATVGVMTNPMDISTFEPVADFTLASAGYFRCYANFKEYKGNGDVIAIVWSDVNADKSTYVYIDDVTIEEVGQCLPPMTVNTVPTDSSVTFSWAAETNIDRWVLLLANTKIDESMLNSYNTIDKKKVVALDTVSWTGKDGDPTVTVNDLDWSTPYYAYVAAICGEGLSWWTELSFKTNCPQAFSLPFVDGFEKYEGLELGCWQAFDTGTGSGYPKIMTSTVHSGAKCVELWSTSTTHRTWIVAPVLEEKLENVMLDFYARSFSATTKSLVYVGTMTDPADPSTFMALDTFYMGGPTEFYHFAVDFGNYQNLGQYVAFSSGHTDTLEMNSDIYIDDVRFQKTDCALPYDIEAQNITQTSLDVVWKGKSSDKWEYYALKSLVPAVDSVLEKVDAKILVKKGSVEMNSKLITLEELQTYTKYYIYLRSSCGTGEWAVDSVMTECFTLNPNVANKETWEEFTDASTSYNVNAVPQCWIGGNGGPSTSTSYLPFIYKSTTYAHSGEMTMRLYGYNTTTASSCATPAWIATPRIETDDMSKIVVNFYVYVSTSYYYVYGVMTDPTDISTFVALDSLKGEGKSVLKSVDLGDYKSQLGNAKYFAWRTRIGASDYIYLDDISIVNAVCPLAKPSVTDITESSARIASGIRTDNNWRLVISDKEIIVDTLEARGLSKNDSVFLISAKDTAKILYNETISGRSKTLSIFQEQTDYYVYVQCDCDSVFGAWTMKHFKTPCTSKTPEEFGQINFTTKEGYVTGSGKELPCWTVGNKNSTSATYIPYVNNTAAYMYNGNNFLYMYNYVSSTANNSGGYAITPMLNVDDISKYQVNFYGRAYNATTDAQRAYGKELIVGVVTDPSDLNTFVAIDTVVGSNTAYEPFSISFENYDGDYLGNKGKYVMFTIEVPSTASYAYFYITGVSVNKIPACRLPYDAVVDSTTEDAAKISWKGYSEKYRVTLAKTLVTDNAKTTYKDWLLDTVVTSTSFEFANLSAGTAYYAYLQPMCGDTVESDFMLGSVMFTTDCPVSKGYDLPYYNDFDKSTQTGSGKRPDCWLGYQWNVLTDTLYSTQTYPYVYTTTSCSYDKKGYSMYLYSYRTASTATTQSHYSTYAIAPLINGDLNKLMVSFYARKSTATKTSYGKTIRVGYVTDFSSEKAMVQSFVKLADVDADEATVNYVYCQVNMEELNMNIPAGARIALVADPQYSNNVTVTSANYGGFYIDNFKIGYPPSCYAPTLETGNTSLYTADIKIIPAKEVNTKWELSVMKDAVYTRNSADISKVIENPDSTLLLIANDTNFTIEGLEAGTMYQIYARTVCGGEDGNSEWSGAPVSVVTKYYYADSYRFGFEKSEGWVLSPLATSDSYFMHPALVCGYEGGAATTSYSYYPYCYENTATYDYSYGDGKDKNNISAMRLYSYNTYYGAYTIFPSVAQPKERSFSFAVRNGYTTISTGKVSTTYAAQLEIGFVDKNKGFETYSAVATIDLPILDKTKVCSAANNYMFKSVTMDLDSATIADKQVVLRVPQNGTSYQYIYIDEVEMGAPKGFSLVALDKITPKPQAATVTWSKLGGPWNLEVYTINAKGEKVATVASFTNLTETTQEISGLQPQTTYGVKLTAAVAPAETKYEVSAVKTFTTPCLPLEPNANGEFFWNFNDPSDWDRSDILPGTAADTAYYKPGCFTVTTTYATPKSYPYYNWLILRKGAAYTSAPTSSSTYAHYEYGRDDSPALRVYSTSTYMTPYIIMPELNCSFDTMMIEFWGRCICNYDATYSTATSQNKALATYMGSSYGQSLVVGVLSDPKDLSTLEIVDTLTYTAYTKGTTAVLMNTDPAGQRYWQKFQLPLGGVSGKYIVLFQPKQGLFFVDDLSIKPVGDNIFAPARGVATAFGSDTASLAWEVKHPSFQTVISVKDLDGNEIIRDTVNGTTYVARGLTPGSDYTWSFYQINGAAKSTEIQGATFTTECLDMNPNGYTNGFELEDGWRLVPGQTSMTYKQTKCWVYGNAGTSAWSSTYCAYNMPTTSTANYAHSGAYGIHIEAYSTTYQGYVAMPAIEDVAAYDTLQVNFWLRAGYHNTGTGKISTQYTTGSTAATADYYYSRSVIVGTMTDPYDATTFVPIDTITYQRILTTQDVATTANDFLFEKASVSLRGAAGKYIAFMSTLYAKGEDRKSTYGHIYLDDISLSKLQECSAPSELKVSNIGSDEATLSWTGCELSDKFILQISTDVNFEEDTALVFNDTVAATTYTLTGIAPNTQYVWHVSSLCGEEESEFSVNASFRTLRTPYYLEDFRNATLDADWTFGTTPAADVFNDSVHAEITGSNSTTYGFDRITKSYGLDGAHYCIPFYSSSTTTSYTYDHYWMLSPVLALADNDSAIMTMDVALTKATSGYSPTEDPVIADYIADDYIFLVAISEDAGQTWSLNNTIGWVGSQLLSIPNKATTLSLDLSKYAGKNIRIGFYREAQTYNSTSAALHFGKIRVNYVDKLSVDTTLCQYEDLEAYGISIDGDKVEAGKHEYRNLQKAGEFDALAGARDTLYTVSAMYYAVPETEISDTICEGEAYSGYDFSQKMKSGVYRRKLQSAYACDSLVTLRLNVTPRRYAEMQNEVICHGESFTWNGVVYNRAGVYRDTLVSSLGCDSIETLTLTFYANEDTIRVSKTIELTDLPYTYEDAQHPYMTGVKPISYPEGTLPGVYVDTVAVLGENCSTLLIHTLTINPETGLEDLDANSIFNQKGVRKVIVKDQMYIIRDDEWFTVQGISVSDPRK